MIRRSHFVISLMLVFALAFSLSLTTYTPTKAFDCPPPPLQGCCVIKQPCVTKTDYVCGYGVSVPGVGCVKDLTSNCPPPPSCP